MCGTSLRNESILKLAYKLGRHLHEILVRMLMVDMTEINSVLGAETVRSKGN
tara:strand:+ start:376 stop:531 length:156 start_codon:yes stop_codon:yes gene_type:complete